MQPYNKNLKQLSRDLRNNMTDVELVALVKVTTQANFRFTVLSSETDFKLHRRFLLSCYKFGD